MCRFSTVRFGIVAVVLSAVVTAAYAEKTRASFESGDFTGWTKQGSGWTVDGKMAVHGEKSALCMVEKGEKPGLKACAREIPEAEAGWVVKVEARIAGKKNTERSKVSIAVICVGKDGKTLREVKKEVTRPNGDFALISLPEMIIPSGAVKTYLMLVVEVTKESKAKEWWRFDDVSIDVK